MGRIKCVRRGLLLRLLLVAGCLLAAVAVPGQTQAAENQISSPTHRQIRVITPKVDGQSVIVNTMTTDADGNLVVAVGGQSMQYEATEGGLGYQMVTQPGFVLKLDSQGQELERWECDLTPSALAIAPGGTIFVGGSGKIARLTADGKMADATDSPHIGDRKTFAKRTIQAQQRLMQSFLSEDSLKPLREMVEQLEEKPEADRSPVEVAQLNSLKTQLEQMESLFGGATEDDEEAGAAEDDDPVDPMMEMQVQQAMAVTSMAASADKVFVCATDPSNGGYSVWSLDHDLNPESGKVIITDLRGCCGQMDIQCCDEKLIVSENSSFQIGIYDLQGKRINSFGRMDRTSREGFGSCCNPMNALPLADGTLLTAESSIGHIKHFDVDGKLIGYVGKASIGGGCKHCAMGYDAANDLYYMMYQDKNQICVLGDREKHPLTEAELAVAQREKDFVAKHVGTWTKEGTKPQRSSFFGSLFGGEVSSPDDSMYPMTSFTINHDGSVSVNAGQYASFMTDATLEILPAEEGDAVNVFRAAIADEQVRMIEMTLTIDDQEMEVDFGYEMKVKLIKQNGNPSSSAQAKSVQTEIAEYEKMLAAEEKVLTIETAQQPCDPSCDGTRCGNPACATKAAIGTNKVREIDSLYNDLFSEEATGAKVPSADAAAAVRTTTLNVIQDYQGDLGTAVEMEFPTIVPRFEYRLIAPADLGKKREKALNELGSEGWEYCGKLGKKMLFKRVSDYTAQEVSQ